MIDKPHCEFCEDLEKETRFLMCDGYDGGYLVETHYALYCPMCGRELPEEVHYD